MKVAPLLLIAGVLFFIIYDLKLRRIDNCPISTIESLIDNDLSLKVYEVKTDDGYILKLFRLRNMNYFDPDQKPIFMQHGLGSSAATFLMNDREAAPAKLFADRGYDVWLGNTRGNYFSRSHTDHDPNSKEFWNFDIGHLKFDLLAEIEFVLDVTTHTQLTYFGHSLGCTMILSSLSDPTTDHQFHLSQKIDKIYCFAPVVYMKEILSPLLTIAYHFYDLIDHFVSAAGIYYYGPGNCEREHYSEGLLNKFCSIKDGLFCPFGFKWTDKQNEHNNMDYYGRYQNFYPTGISFKVIEHFHQNHKFQNKDDEDYFKHYDYGSKEKNLERYQTENPPSYDLKLVKTDINIYYGDNDMYLNEENIQKLAKSLPNSQVKLRFMKDWGHVTFELGKKEIVQPLFLEIYEEMKKERQDHSGV